MVKFFRLIKFLYFYGRKIELPNNSSAKKFNIHFLKKVRKLFAGITYILYLNDTTIKQEHYGKYDFKRD